MYWAAEPADDEQHHQAEPRRRFGSEHVPDRSLGRCPDAISTASSPTNASTAPARCRYVRLMNAARALAGGGRGRSP